VDVTFPFGGRALRFSLVGRGCIRVLWRWTCDLFVATFVLRGAGAFTLLLLTRSFVVCLLLRGGCVICVAFDFLVDCFCYTFISRTGEVQVLWI
jgi:hypothetical protein